MTTDTGKTALREQVDVRREPLARWAYTFTMASRWTAKAPMVGWQDLREESRQFWLDEAHRILAQLDVLIQEGDPHQFARAGNMMRVTCCHIQGDGE